MPATPSHLVISEFRSRGPGGADDEFVELFNPTGATVNIGNWMIKTSSGCGTTISTLMTIASGTTLSPGQHFLAAASGGSITSPDQTFSPSIADNGGVALTSAGVIVDQVGMCAGTQYKEGSPLAPLTGTSDQSYARLPIGQYSGCIDTNDNVADFLIIKPPEPQKKSSPIRICPGVVTATPTATVTPSRTRTPTRTPTPLPGVLVINEFLPFPRTDWNGDGVADVRDEYIEIMNAGTDPVNIKNWKLDDGDEGSAQYRLPERILLPREIVRFYGSETGILLSNGGDSVRLFRPTGQIADAYTYPAVEAADITWCRLPDGSKGEWDFVCQPTPGRPNVRALAGAGTPPATEGGETTQTCVLPDTVPSIILLAECNAPGLGIWNWGLWSDEEFWLDDLFKAPVFIE